MPTQKEEDITDYCECPDFGHYQMGKALFCSRCNRKKSPEYAERKAIPLTDKQPDEKEQKEDIPDDTFEYFYRRVMRFGQYSNWLHCSKDVYDNLPEELRMKKIKAHKQYSEEQELRYRYFVSYFFKDGKGNGFGNIHIIRNQPILTYDDIKALTEFLEIEIGKNPVVLNYILFPGQQQPVTPLTYSLTIDQIKGIWEFAYYAGITDYRKEIGHPYTDDFPDMKQYLSTLGIDAGELK